VGARAGRYPPEYRERLVELAREGRSPGSLAREFEPSEQTIRNWVRASGHVPGAGYLPQWVLRLAEASSLDSRAAGGGTRDADRVDLDRQRRDVRPSADPRGAQGRG